MDSIKLADILFLMEPEESVQVCQLVPDEEALDAENDGVFLKIGDRYYILLAEGMACEMYVDLKADILEKRVASLQSIMTRIAIDPAGALTAASPATRFFVEAKDEETDRDDFRRAVDDYQDFCDSLVEVENND